MLLSAQADDVVAGAKRPRHFGGVPAINNTQEWAPAINLSERPAVAPPSSPGTIQDDDAADSAEEPLNRRVLHLLGAPAASSSDDRADTVASPGPAVRPPASPASSAASLDRPLRLKVPGMAEILGLVDAADHMPVSVLRHEVESKFGDELAVLYPNGYLFDDGDGYPIALERVRGSLPGVSLASPRNSHMPACASPLADCLARVTPADSHRARCACRRASSRWSTWSGAVTPFSHGRWEVPKPCSGTWP